MHHRNQPFTAPVALPDNSYRKQHTTSFTRFSNTGHIRGLYKDIVISLISRINGCIV